MPIVSSGEKPLNALSIAFFFVTALVVVTCDDLSTWSCLVLASKLYREPWKREAGLFRVAVKRLGVRKLAFALFSPIEFAAFFLVMLLFDTLFGASGIPLGWFMAGFVWGFGLFVARNNYFIAGTMRNRLAGKPDPYAPDIGVGENSSGPIQAKGL
jgi:hypothetical protein